MNIKAMRKITLLPAIIFFLLTAGYAQKLSVDVAGVRNHTFNLYGANTSVFYHFNESLSAGVEANRFFAKKKGNADEEIYFSAWDYDFNLHYLLPVTKKFSLYPVLGFGFSFEREESKAGINRLHRKYFNTGAGILFNTGIIKPHIEYVLATHRKTEQFALAGITIELNFKK
jgi:hypothetical protein